MKSKMVTGIAAASILLAGCGKRLETSGDSVGLAKAPADAAAASPVALADARAATIVSTPVTQPILAAWQEGDKARAINRFLEADWNARPIFPAGMALNLTDGQLKALSDADRQLKTGEMMVQLDLIKQLASAVAEAGRQAASKGDAAQARKCFMSLKQFGAALDTPARLQFVQVVGRVSKNMANTGLAKLGP